MSPDTMFLTRFNRKLIIHWTILPIRLKLGDERTESCLPQACLEPPALYWLCFEVFSYIQHHRWRPSVGACRYSRRAPNPNRVHILPFRTQALTTRRTAPAIQNRIKRIYHPFISSSDSRSFDNRSKIQRQAKLTIRSHQAQSDTTSAGATRLPWSSSPSSSLKQPA